MKSKEEIKKIADKNKINMNKEFVTYKQALALKKLGFDELCFGWYSESKEKVTYHIPFSHNKDYDTRTRPWTTDEFDCCTAPLWQQAFQWMREKYGYVFVKDYGLIPHFTIIQNMLSGDKKWTYEEAKQACLDKLIKIVEEGSVQDWIKDETLNKLKTKYTLEELEGFLHTK